MKPLRKEFWDRSKALIEFCSEEELRVLRQQAAKEIEKRLKALQASYNLPEDGTMTKEKKVFKKRK